MMNIIELLKKNERVDEYKINLNQKESYELFFVKGKLETTRRTNTCDKEVTVYVNHGEFKGDSSFIVYPICACSFLKDEKTAGLQKETC